MAHKMLTQLRAEPTNRDSALVLASHPFVKAAEEGRLTKAQMQAFVQEQYHLQWANVISFGKLAGLVSYRPRYLSNETLPSFPNGTKYNLFAELLARELSAAKLLLKHAHWLELGGNNALWQYEPSPIAQIYPSYWSSLALQNRQAAAAAASAVTLPLRWKLCNRLHAAYSSGTYGEATKEDLAFVKALAEPIDGLDDIAAAIMIQERASYTELATPTRSMQYYDLLFWDSLMEANATADEIIEMTLNNLYDEGYASNAGYTDADYADAARDADYTDDVGYFDGRPAAKY
jgi:pyrroloquinoline quinone (PQQ) biosynthesis protein C